MFVNGCDCSVVIKTENKETDIPYTDETIREAVSFLEEEASVEGDGVRRGLFQVCGVTGCVVTPLTIGTAPLLLYLAMGAAGNPVYVSETKNLFQYFLNLTPTEDTEHFDLIQNRGGERLFYEGCRVKGFELRVLREETIKLKLDFTNGLPPVVYQHTDRFERKEEERFNGDSVTYSINGSEYNNIYGLTLLSKKQGGTKTELWIKRAKERGPDIPAVIEEMTVTARLLRDTYENRYFGMFRITVKRLVMLSDETEINTADTVIGPVRYYVAGGVSAEVFGGGEEIQ